MRLKDPLGVDVDDVVLDLMSEWLRRYNDEYGDGMTPADIHSWSLAQWVKPECGKAIYKYLRQPDLYDHVDPMPGAVEAIDRIREMGHRVVFVTSCTVGTTDAKVRCLQKHKMLPKGAKVDDFIAAHDKALIRLSCLIDDGVHNVEAFPGKAVLVTRPHNRTVSTKRPRVKDITEVADLLERKREAAA